jgi:hypothetical protein
VSTSKIPSLLRTLSAGEVIAERLHDDLPCCVCDAVGGVVIVEVEGRTYDLCRDCAIKAGFIW